MHNNYNTTTLRCINLVKHFTSTKKCSHLGFSSIYLKKYEKQNGAISIHFLQTFFCYPSLLTYIALYIKDRCPYKTTITFYLLNHHGCLKRSSTTHCCAVIITTGDTVTHAAIRTRDSHGVIWFTEVFRFFKINEFTL